MLYTDLKKQLNDEKFYSVYLLEGEDAFFRKHAINDIVEKFVTEKDLNYVSFDGTDFDFDSFLSSIEMLPFMSKKRVTLINEFYPNEKELKRLEGILSNPPADSVLVIANEKVSKPFKKFDGVAVVDCVKADESVIQKWIKATCLKYGADVLPSASKLICDFCLCDMTRIEGEINKLCSFVGTDGVIDDDVVKSLVSKETEYEIYAVTDAIGRKKYSNAIFIINELLSNGETKQRLISTLYYYFRRLLHTAISNKTVDETAELLGVKKFAVEKYKQQAKLFKVVNLKKAVDILADSDFLFKSGKLDIDEAFWLSLFQIMTAE